MKNAHGNTFIMYWHKNPEWYRINEKLDRFELTSAAPEKARRSFELFKKINGLNESEGENHEVT